VTRYAYNGSPLGDSNLRADKIFSSDLIRCSAVSDGLWSKPSRNLRGSHRHQGCQPSYAWDGLQEARQHAPQLRLFLGACSRWSGVSSWPCRYHQFAHDALLAASRKCVRGKVRTDMPLAVAVAVAANPAGCSLRPLALHSSPHCLSRASRQRSFLTIGGSNGRVDGSIELSLAVEGLLLSESRASLAFVGPSYPIEAASRSSVSISTEVSASFAGGVNAIGDARSSPSSRSSTLRASSVSFASRTSFCNF